MILESGKLKRVDTALRIILHLNRFVVRFMYVSLTVICERDIQNGALKIKDHHRGVSSIIRTDDSILSDILFFPTYARRGFGE